MYFIFRYVEKFNLWSEVNVNSPTRIKFSILPTNQLVLYVLTNSPSSPFIVYAYKGEEGMQKLLKSATTPISTMINAFNFENNHYVALTHESTITLLQAIFKRL